MTEYNPHFYDAIREGCRQSANTVVPLLVERYGVPSSVVDVGCGEGWWGEAYREAGVPTVLGFENGEAEPGLVGFPIVDHDITTPLPLPHRFGTAVCLEVAEHLPASSAVHLVSQLVQASDLIVFSAAIPGQVGTGHINCRPPAYWSDLFASRGYVCDDLFRLRIWDDQRVEGWYRNNLLIFTRADEDDEPYRPARYLIHPEVWIDHSQDVTPPE